MSLLPIKEIQLESSLAPEAFKKRLAIFVEYPGATKDFPPEFKGVLEEKSFKLKYMLRSSQVEGDIEPKKYGSEIKIRVSLTSGYNAFAIFGYVAFTVAVVLVSSYLIGSAKYHRPITAAGIFNSGLAFIPCVVAYFACASELKQVSRWIELFFKQMLHESQAQVLERR